MMSEFSSLTPEDLALLSSVIAIALAKNRSADEVNVLGNLVAAVGAQLLTISAQDQSLRALQDQSKQSD